MMDKFVVFLQNSFPQYAHKAKDIASNFSAKSFKKGDLLLKEGEISDYYLFLEEGCMRSFLYDTEGKEITMNFYTALQPVFEVASFFQRIPSEEYIEAVSDSYGKVISYEKLNFLFHSIPEFREIGRALLVRGFVQFKKRTLSLINKTAEERYAEMISKNPEIFQYASLKHIASYLGVTDTSLSRIRKEFSRK